MTSYRVETTIAAPAETVWEILTDAAAYPEWNPAVVRVEGTIGSGEKIKVVATVNPDRAFPVTVSGWSPPNSMVWSGGMPLGLFKGVRTFTLRPDEQGNTVFVMEEVYSGLLAGMITRSIPDLTESFDQYAAGLKAKAQG